MYHCVTERERKTTDLPRLYETLVQGMRMDTVLIDSAKAFDTVNHIVLLDTAAGGACRVVTTLLPNKISFRKSGANILQETTKPCDTQPSEAGQIQHLPHRVTTAYPFLA